jgi:hypothetical protein
MSRLRVAAFIALALGAAPTAHEPVGQAQAQQPAPAPAATPEAEARGLASEVVEIMTNLRMVLGSVSNAVSARDAGPRLRELRTRLETLSPRIESLGPQDRATLADVVARGFPSVRGLAERVTELRGTEALWPDLEAAVARLQSWLG